MTVMGEIAFLNYVLMGYIWNTTEIVLSLSWQAGRKLRNLYFYSCGFMDILFVYNLPDPTGTVFV